MQAARADGKIVFYRLKTLDRPPPVFAVRQKQARPKRSANQQYAPATSLSPVLHLRNWKLAAVPFYPKGAFSRQPRTFLLASLRMQTGADCTFYYHFNGAILAVRPRPIP